MRDLRACTGIFTPISHVQNLLSIAEPEGRNPWGSEVELVAYPIFLSLGS